MRIITGFLDFMGPANTQCVELEGSAIDYVDTHRSVPPRSGRRYTTSALWLQLTASLSLVVLGGCHVPNWNLSNSATTAWLQGREVTEQQVTNRKVAKTADRGSEKTTVHAEEPEEHGPTQPSSNRAPIVPRSAVAPTKPRLSGTSTIRGQSPVNRYTAQSSPQGLPSFPSSTSEATLIPPNQLPPLSANTTSPQSSSPSIPSGNALPQGSVPYGGLAPPAQQSQLIPQTNTPNRSFIAPPETGVGDSNIIVPPPVSTQPAIPYGYGSGYGSGSGGGTSAPGGWENTIAPGATQSQPSLGESVAPGAIGTALPITDPLGISAPEAVGYQPRERVSPIDVYVQEARTGRIILGGSVNSDLGVAGQLIIDERNFNIRRVPRSWDDLWSGRAFRGGGQNFRMELMPGSRVERYTVSWTERNLFGYLPYSLSVGGFLFTRQFRDWTEQRLGGRVALGYEVTKDLSVSSELRMEDVKLFDPRVSGVTDLDDAQGSNDIYTARFRVARDTRDSPFMSSQGALLELIFDQVFGEYDYSRGRINYSRYFKLRERPDGTGRHVLATTWKLGFTGAQTPIFENFFAGGYSTLRGFSFRGAGPVINDVQVGGEFLALGSVEYVFPLTADEMLRGVAFVDYGTVEENIELNSENFRVAPGLGLRVTVPALGPAPLAFDFAYPINHADNDDRQLFSFFMGFTR